MKIKKIALLAMSVLLCGVAMNFTNAQEFTDVNITITGGTLTIGSTGAFYFNSMTVPMVSTLQEKQFTGDQYFWVQDFKGYDSGFYTTVSVTDLTGLNTSSVIDATNLKIKVDSALAVMLEGSNNADVVVNGSLVGAYVSFDTPITFVNRGPNANLGLIGKYGVWPWLQIDIPAYQAPDSYQGVITYTLYDRSI